jgi:hypothetical protein
MQTRHICKLARSHVSTPMTVPRTSSASVQPAARRRAPLVFGPPVVRVPPQLVFGLPPFWCIVSCPTCDAEGFLQEDVHPLPAAQGTRCHYGHLYRIALETAE